MGVPGTGAPPGTCPWRQPRDSLRLLGLGNFVVIEYCHSLSLPSNRNQPKPRQFPSSPSKMYVLSLLPSPSSPSSSLRPQAPILFSPLLVLVTSSSFSSSRLPLPPPPSSLLIPWHWANLRHWRASQFWICRMFVGAPWHNCF